MRGEAIFTDYFVRQSVYLSVRLYTIFVKEHYNKLELSKESIAWIGAYTYVLLYVYSQSTQVANRFFPSKIYFLFYL